MQVPAFTDRLLTLRDVSSGIVGAATHVAPQRECLASAKTRSVLERATF